jgi:hypothetical protein
LKCNNQNALVFDAKDVDVDERGFAQTPIVAWKDFYGEVAEELPADMPEQKGKRQNSTCTIPFVCPLGQ